MLLSNTKIGNILFTSKYVTPWNCFHKLIVAQLFNKYSLIVRRYVFMVSINIILLSTSRSFKCISNFSY